MERVQRNGGGMQGLKSALQALNVKAIYWVDDENADAADVSVEKMVDDLATKIAAEPPDYLGQLIGKAPAAWKPRMGRVRAQLSSDQRLEEDTRPDRKDQIATLLAELAEADDNGPVVLTSLLDSEAGALTLREKAALTDLFAPLASELGYTWRPLSFSDWEKEQERIRALHSASSPALVLLDQQNSREKSALDGVQILRAICTEQTHGAGFKFLLVTSTCTPEGEYQHSAGLARMLNIEQLGIRSPLFTLSKTRISRALGSEDAQAALAEHFNTLLRRLRLSLLNQELAVLVKEVVTKAAEKAFARLTAMSLHEFLYAVTQSSQTEGVSELDTLLRLLSIEQRDALLSEVVRNGALRRALERVREHSVAIRKQELSADSALAALRTREVYWPPRSVNELLHPIAVGDIFEHRSGAAKEYYILLGNDCDLMLRSDGTRKSEFGLLAKLSKVKGDLDAQLECPLPERPEFRYVALNSFWAVRTEVLDLSWLNTRGACTWDPEVEWTGLHLLGSQQARAKTLEASFRKKATRVTLVASAPFPVSQSKSVAGRVDFRMRRTNRLSAQYAHGILARFASVLARPSFDHDYATPRDLETA